MLRIANDERPHLYLSAFCIHQLNSQAGDGNTNNFETKTAESEAQLDSMKAKNIEELKSNIDTSYSYELIDTVPDGDYLLDSNSLPIKARLNLVNSRFFNITLHSKFESACKALIALHFNTSAVPGIENLTVNIHGSDKIISIDPFGGKAAYTHDITPLGLSHIDSFYLEVESGSKAYLFEPNTWNTGLTEINGTFHLIENISIDNNDVKSTNITFETTKTSNIIVSEEPNVETFDNDVELMLNADGEKEIIDVELLDSDAKNVEEMVDEELNKSIYQSVHSTISPSLKSVTPYSNGEVDHAFELLGYYILDFNTNELEVRIRSSNILDPLDLISLSIVDYEGLRFTSELVSQNNSNILIARFPNWNYGDSQLEVEAAIVHYKAQDYDLLTRLPNSASSTPSQYDICETKSQLSLSTNSESELCNDAEIRDGLLMVENKKKLELGTSPQSDKSELLIPQFNSQHLIDDQETEYVFISRTESLVDESDYSVLSMDE